MVAEDILQRPDAFNVHFVQMQRSQALGEAQRMVFLIRQHLVVNVYRYGMALPTCTGTTLGDSIK